METIKEVEIGKINFRNTTFLNKHILQLPISSLVLYSELNFAGDLLMRFLIFESTLLTYGTMHVNYCPKR